ncbi:MAG: hypothetical protein AB7P52_14995 [Alphaproteobacteria bacterium]
MLRRGRAAFLLAPWLLAGCFPADSARAPAPELLRPPVASLDTVKLDPAASPAATMSPATAGQEAEAAAPGPELLSGLDRAGLRQTLGTPTLQRREAGAEVWQYQAESCVMDAFLYATPESEGEPRVTYVELRRNGVAILTDPGERRDCYAELAATGRRDAAFTGDEP